MRSPSTRSLPAEEGGDLEAAVVADGGDPVLLPVDRAAAVAVVAGQVPAVAAGLDDVADAGPGSLQAERHAALVVDAAEAYEVGAQLRGEPGHLLVGVDDEQGVLAGEGVGEPGPGGRGLGLLEGAAVEEPAVLVVVGQDGLVVRAEPERSGALPGLGEPAGLGQLVPGSGGGDEVHAAGRADRGELVVVAGQQQLRPRLLAVGVDADQVGGVGHRRLVDHDQVTGAEAPALVVALRGARGQPILGGEPAGDVAGVQAFAGEDFGGDLGGGQADHPARLPGPQSRVLPGLGEGADHEALAGAGRADQGLDLRAGGEDAAYGGGLVGAELDALGGQVGDEPVRLGHGDGRRVTVGGGGREEPLVVQVVRGGVEPAARRLVGRRAVGQPEVIGQSGVARPAGIQRDRQFQGLGGQPVEETADLLRRRGGRAGRAGRC